MAPTKSRPQAHKPLRNFLAMEAEIKKLTATIAQMASKLNNENSNPNTSIGDRKSRRPQMKKERNMGGYCHSHGFHPVGKDHTSKTCSWKKEGHKTEATWTNQMGGDPFGPPPNVLPSISKTTPLGKANHPPQIDTDWGIR